MKDERILKFIASYLRCRSPTQAGREAGLTSPHYYLRRPEIYAAIQAINAKALMKYGYDAYEIVERTKEIANIDPIEFQRPDGSFKSPSEMTAEARRAIKKFEVKNLYGQDTNGMQIVIGQVMKIELWDKLKAIEMLGSEKNIFKKTTVVEHDVTKNMAQVLLESGRRADQRALNVGRDVTPEGGFSDTIETDGAEERRETEASDSDESGWGRS